MAKAKEGVQRFGKFLSGMVMPNIGAFIAWGFLTAIFTTGGWFPNEQLATIISPMLKFLIPIMIAGQGGYMVAGNRGRVIGMISIVGAIVASDYTMLMGAMIMGPLAGWIIKKWDRWAKTWTPTGLEMLVDNFSIGLIGLALVIFSYYAVGPLMGAILVLLTAGTQVLVNNGLLPFLAFFIEPAKVLFLNNAIGNGIFVPIATEQALTTGKSIMFMLESNPGPGLGLLLAYAFFCKDDDTRQSAPGAIIVQFIGGIHEIYFPYVLMNPRVIIGPMLGNFAAILWYVATGTGLVGPASPGSIIGFLSMAPGGAIVQVLVGVGLAAVISFAVSSPIVRASDVSLNDQSSSEESAEAVAATLVADKTAITAGSVAKVVFACDAGMGSSAMAASRFMKRISSVRPDIKVTHSSVDEIPSDADVVVCQKTLAERAHKSAPSTAQIVVINNFMNDPAINALQTQLTTSATTQKAAVAATNAASKATEQTPKPVNDVMTAKDVRLGLPSVSREEAIRQAGRMLVDAGCVDEGYIDAMVERDKEVSVYLDNGIAIPHGTNASKKFVKKTGVVALQYPDGIDFDGNKAYALFGIAGKGDEHLEVLAKIAGALDDKAAADKLRTSKSVDDFLKVLS